MKYEAADVIRLTNTKPNTAVAWFLMLSYLYYVADKSPYPDAVFDHVCNVLRDRWDEIKSPYKHMVERNTRTGFYIKEEEYPNSIVGLAENLLVGE